MDTNVKAFNGVTTFCTVFAFIAISAVILWFSTVVDNEVYNAALTEVKDTALKLGLVIEENVEDAKIDLSIIASYIAMHEMSEEEIILFFNNQSHVEKFMSLYFISPHGKGISSEGERYDFSNNETFLKALQNDYFITKYDISEETGAIILDVAVSIPENSKKEGVLFAKISFDGFVESLDELARETGDAFLLDRNLNIVYTTSPEHQNASFIPESDIEMLTSDEVDSALQNFKEGKSGGFFYTIDEDLVKIAAYTPIQMTELALAVNVEARDVNSNLIDAVNNVVSVSVMIFILLILVTVYIWDSKTYLLQKVEENAYYDGLTGLPNLIKLKNDMEYTLKHYKNDAFSIIVFDIENFKVINEIYGYDVGDRVLKAIKDFSIYLEEPSLQTARISGTEFAFFAHSGFFDSLDSLVVKCKTFFDKEIPELIEHQETFKVGRYHIEPGETNVDDIIHKVSIAHTMAKETEGVFFCDYEVLYNIKLVKEAIITNKMKTALENNEFKAYLQPKINPKDESMVGAEALVRWIEDDGTIILPNDFIPLFEKNGFITQVDRCILIEVCKLLKTWKDSGKSLIPLSVNLSRANLRNHRLVEDIISVVDSYDIPRKYIDIELTESSVIENQSILDSVMRDLRDAGFKISIDDFGSGYSSLGLLKDMTADTLKLDKSFFSGTKKDSRKGNVIIEGATKIIHNLGMSVVAEGIETKDQVEYLKDIDCDAIQGYYYSKPMSISEFEKKYVLPKSKRTYGRT